MRTHWFSTPVLLLVLLAGVACGGGGDDGGAATTVTPGDTPGVTQRETDAPAGEAGLDGYFAAFEAVAISANDRLETIDLELSGPFDTDAEYVEVTVNGVAEAGQVLEAAALDLSALVPPPEAEAAHDAFMQALAEVLQATSDLYFDIEGAQTGDELDEIAAGFSDRLAAANEAFDEACFALQDIADGSGLDRDLHCGDD